MQSLPVRLERPPLVEAIFEVRFAGGKLFASDLLPGMLYGKLTQAFENAEPLPISTLPREMREEDPNLRYQASVRLNGHEGALLVGDHVFSISKTPPYEGWSVFRKRISEVLLAVHATGLVVGLERYSLKCVNVISSVHRVPISALNMDVRLDGFDLANRGFRLRSEIDMSPFITVVEVGANVTIETAALKREGVLVSLDTIRDRPAEGFWSDISTHIDEVHTKLRGVFFGLLTSETLNGLGPIWSEE